MPRGPGEEHVKLEAHEQHQLELIERHLENVDSSATPDRINAQPSPVRIALTTVWCGALLIGLAADSFFLVLLAAAGAVLFGLGIPARNDDTRYEPLLDRSDLIRRRLALFAAWCLTILIGLSIDSAVIILLALTAVAMFGLHMCRRHH